MFKVLTITLISTMSLYSFADVPKDLRGQVKQNKLVIHACDTKALEVESCRVTSDINLSDVISALSSGGLSLYSQETIDVKKGVSPEGFVFEDPYWKTCDAEDGDCIEWSIGAFRNSIANQYAISIIQREAILAKIQENSLRQNTHVYFFNRNTKVGQSVDDGLTTFFDLRKTQLVVK